MWTLRGWKETDDDGNEIMRAEEISEKPKEKPHDEDSPKDGQNDSNKDEKNDNEKENDSVNENVNENGNGNEISETSKTSWNNAEGIKAVRKVYRRVYTHCPTKALIYMKYAAFEESIGNISDNEEECGARYILKTLLKRYPNMIGT